jgi:hypothetical protein
VTGKYSDDPFDGWDDNLGPVKEEPDCFLCNDSGCSSCSHHPHCDCVDCFERVVDEYEMWDAPDRLEPAYTGPFDDEFPF